MTSQDDEYSPYGSANLTKCGLDTCPCTDWPESMNRQVDFDDSDDAEELTVVEFRQITQEEEDDNVW